LIVNILTLLLIPIIAFIPDNILRIILSLPAVLFFPGFTLLCALYPRRENLKDIERFVLSCGMSIAIVPLVGLGLNYTPWGIHLYPILISISAFIFIMSLIAWIRGRKLSQEKSVSLHINLKMPSASRMWSGQSTRDKIITIVLAAIVIGALGTLYYVVIQPRGVEKFSEFYVLNSEGEANNYPHTILLGQSSEVILGIINHENAPTEYRIQIVIDGEKTGEVGPVNLDSAEKWEQKITITPTHTGENEKIEFLLYKNSSTESVESLSLWVLVQ